MTGVRFAYLTDTHIGCNETGYCLQARYLGHDARLFEGLSQWLHAQQVAFVVHGGDLTDHGTPLEIACASELCSMLNLPVYVSLGNHDLAQPESMQQWRTAGTTGHGRFLPDGHDCFAVTAGEVLVVVVTHHWHPHVDHCWVSAEPQQPRLSREQVEWLDATLRRTTRPVIAVTHAPLNDVRGDIRHDEAAFHPPYAPYLATWRELAAEHANLRLVLCGHNHAHSNCDQGTFVSCTTAAFNEVAAQLRLVTITAQAVEVRTFSLAGALGLGGVLAQERAWSVGPSADHRLRLPLH